MADDIRTDGGAHHDNNESVATINERVIGGQPAILANLALANQIFNTNIQQQNTIQQQQALFQLELAALAKCVQMITAIDPASPDAMNQLKSYKEVMEMFIDIFSRATK